MDASLFDLKRRSFLFVIDTKPLLQNATGVVWCPDSNFKPAVLRPLQNAVRLFAFVFRAVCYASEMCIAGRICPNSLYSGFAPRISPEPSNDRILLLLFC